MLVSDMKRVCVYCQENDVVAVMVPMACGGARSVVRTFYSDLGGRGGGVLRQQSISE